MEDIVSDDGKVVLSLADRLLGRYLAKDIVNEETGEVLARRNDFVDEALASKLDKAGIKVAYIRSNLTCNAKSGVCMKCYGRNLATNEIVEVGEAVGVIAAQSIGEPGTQLTMRTSTMVVLPLVAILRKVFHVFRNFSRHVSQKERLLFLKLMVLLRISKKLKPVLLYQLPMLLILKMRI